MDTKREYVSCSCTVCKNACRTRPGWFIPEQLAEIEKFFGKSIHAMLGRELAIDWGCDRDMTGSILILAPNIKNNRSIQYPAIPRGECVFVGEKGCIIYPIRPYECGVSVHSDDEEKDLMRHVEIAAKWKICDILKDYRDKVTCYEPSFFDLYGIEAKNIENKHMNFLEKIRKQQ